MGGLGVRDLALIFTQDSPPAPVSQIFLRIVTILLMNVVDTVIVHATNLAIFPLFWVGQGSDLRGKPAITGNSGPRCQAVVGSGAGSHEKVTDSQASVEL